MRFTFLLALLGLALSCFAQTNSDVVYLEKVGDGNIRVFSVTVPVDKKLDKMQEAANQLLLNTLLFDGVNNYNNGQALVGDPFNKYALSIVDPKNRVFNSFCKNTYLENSDPKTAGHFIIELNHYNLMRLLKMRGAMNDDFIDEDD